MDVQEIPTNPDESKTNSLCNKLEKLAPPSFVTTISSDRRSVILTWSTLVTKSKYETLKDLLNSEISILSGYIERKGTQLRLEKALMLTRQIHKISQRWRLNDFYPQLKQFENSIGIFDEKTGCLVTPDSASRHLKRDERLPSSQWANWVVYLALRDTALLSKITIECENTITFWLGLIASSHHWGDSLVISGILSRIWFLCSNLMEDFIQIIYPTLLKVSCHLRPNKAINWPDTKFVAPSDLYKWIRHEMKLPFRPIDLNMDVKLPVQRKNVTSRVNLSFLSNYFEEEEADKMEGESNLSSVQQSESEKEDEVEILVEQHVRKKSDSSDEDDGEDLGMVVERVQPAPKKKGKSWKEKKNRARQYQQPGGCTPKWQQVRAYWKKFLNGADESLKTIDGRRQLIKKIKKYSGQESDQKMKVKLTELQKLLVKSDGRDIETLSAFSKFQIYTEKYVRNVRDRDKSSNR